MRLTAQLSDARAGRQLWSERFDRELEDIFEVLLRATPPIGTPDGQ